MPKGRNGVSLQFIIGIVVTLFMGILAWGWKEHNNNINNQIKSVANQIKATNKRIDETNKNIMDFNLELSDRINTVDNWSRKIGLELERIRGELKIKSKEEVTDSASELTEKVASTKTTQ